MDNLFRTFLVLQIALFEVHLLERIKGSVDFSSWQMRMLRIGAFACMLLCLFAKADMIPAVLGMTMVVLQFTMIKTTKAKDYVVTEKTSVFCYCVLSISLIFFMSIALYKALCGCTSDQIAHTSKEEQISTSSALSFVRRDVLLTANPFVKWGGAYLQDGRYVVILKDFNRTFPLSISYDRTNSVYEVDAGTEGSFNARCVIERSGGPILVSLTASDSALKKVYGQLTESEGALLAKLYVTARLVRKGISYDVWLLNSAKGISDGCRVSGLPADRLLPMLPPTNAPPFVYSGKLLRLGDDGGILSGDQAQVSLMNDEGRLNNDDKVLVNFLCGKDVAKNVSITKSEDNRYLYYHMKFTNQQESCVIKIDKKSGEAVNVKKAEP